MMGIIRFDPFREMDRLQNEVNRLFDGYNNGASAPASETRAASAPFADRLWSPAVDVAETGSEIVLRAELPGMTQDAIDVELTGDTLTLRGERKFEAEKRRDSFVRVERAYGKFQRSFTLGVPVQHSAVTATYLDGVLEVHLPKSEANKPRKVQVTSAANVDDAVSGRLSGAGQNDIEAAAPRGNDDGMASQSASGDNVYTQTASADLQAASAN